MKARCFHENNVAVTTTELDWNQRLRNLPDGCAGHSCPLLIGEYVFFRESVRREAWLIEIVKGLNLKPSMCADTKHHVYLLVLVFTL